MTKTAEETEQTWWAAPRFLISAMSIVLLVFIGIVLFVVTGDEEDAPVESAAPSQSTTARQAPTMDAAPVRSGDSTCGLDTSGGTTLTAPPKDTTWEYLNGLFGPKSETHGPGTVDPDTGVRSCFSHTPEGALMAVAGFFATSGDPQLFLDTVRARAIDGPGKDKNLGLIQKRVDENDTTTTPISIAAFKLLAYSDDKASIELVLGAEAGQETYYQTQSADIIWQDGDWYFLVRENGKAGSISGQISDLSGYVPWGPDNG